MAAVGTRDAYRSLLTVKQFASKHLPFSEASLRNLVFNATPRQTSRGPIPGNGLDRAILRVGRKVLVDEAEFFAWLEEQNQRSRDGNATVPTVQASGGHHV